MRKMIVWILAICLIFTGSMPILATPEKSEDIAILYTNDIHTYIDGPLSYDVLAGIKENLQEKYAYVYLVDAGDHVQGTAYGSMDKGEHIISLMNSAGYDVATLGNHEFDYGMEGCKNVLQWAQYPYISANFFHVEKGENTTPVLDGYKIFEAGEEKIAFVGVMTPETISKSTPSYFQDEAGNYIYAVAGGKDGALLYEAVQGAVDAALAQGATTVIALGHLGVEEGSGPWTSRQTIANTSGIDAFIDGHSHTVIKAETVSDKDGETVVLTQTGEYFNRIGMMVIDSQSGEITTDFIEYEEITEPAVDADGNAQIDEDGQPVMETVGYRLVSALYTDETWLTEEDTQTLKADWIEQVDGQLEQQIGTADVVLDNYDPDGNRLVRMQSTNSGEFAADALYYLFDSMDMNVDVAVMNGGGVRNQALTGPLTYKNCKEIHPFGNVACLQKVTGQQLLDALEWSVRDVGKGENGNFLHVSGIRYAVDTTVESTVQGDEAEVWIGGPTGEYRVHSVEVYDKQTNTYAPLELDKVYALAGYNYTLRDLGGGYSMFTDGENVLDYVMEDYMVLAHYVQAFADGVVEATNSPLLEKYPGMKLDYEKVDGCGRFRIETKPQPQPAPTQPPETQPQPTENSQIPAQEPKNDTAEMVVAFVVLGVLVVALICVLVVKHKRKKK